jgi:hypothetical protein
MTEAEHAYNFPPMPEGPMNLWVDQPGGVPPLLTHLAEMFRQMVPLGGAAAEVAGELLGGGRFALSEHQGKRPVCLLFGSRTDPPIMSNLNATEPSLNGLYDRYQDKVQFVFVYTREAHPGSGIGPHQSMDEKRQRAQELRDAEQVRLPILVDGLDGAIHQRWTMMPNSAYLISRAGVVVAKSMLLDCSVLNEMVGEHLTWDALDDGDTVIKKSYHERIHHCRAPYQPAARAKECAALEETGPEMLGAIRQMAGFDPLTWKRA